MGFAFASTRLCYELQEVVNSAPCQDPSGRWIATLKRTHGSREGVRAGGGCCYALRWRLLMQKVIRRYRRHVRTTSAGCLALSASVMAPLFGDFRNGTELAP